MVGSGTTAAKMPDADTRLHLAELAECADSLTSKDSRMLWANPKGYPKMELDHVITSPRLL